jgi:hypothetical protein
MTALSNAPIKIPDMINNIIVPVIAITPMVSGDWGSHLAKGVNHSVGAPLARL